MTSLTCDFMYSLNGVVVGGMLLMAGFHYSNGLLMFFGSAILLLSAFMTTLVVGEAISE